jgi:hypothetical protein
MNPQQIDISITKRPTFIGTIPALFATFRPGFVSHAFTVEVFMYSRLGMPFANLLGWMTGKVVKVDAALARDLLSVDIPAEFMHVKEGVLAVVIDLLGMDKK